MSARRAAYETVEMSASQSTKRAGPQGPHQLTRTGLRQSAFEVVNSGLEFYESPAGTNHKCSIKSRAFPCVSYASRAPRHTRLGKV
jgi:hypothetical protein